MRISDWGSDVCSSDLTSDEWIVGRTGIRFRHIAEPDETTATLGADAAKQALAAAGLEPSDIGLLIVATATPDNTFPASAPKVQALLGVPACIAFAVAAVCSGFLSAVSVDRKGVVSGYRVSVRVDLVGCRSL